MKLPFTKKIFKVSKRRENLTRAFSRESYIISIFNFSTLYEAFSTMEVCLRVTFSLFLRDQTLYQRYIKNPVLGEPVELIDTGNEIEIHNKLGRLGVVPGEMILKVRSFNYSTAHVSSIQPVLNRVCVELKNH